MKRIKVNEEVAQALSEGGPVLALETSGMVGGLPFPQNLELARDVDLSARKGGAVPARVAVIDGTVHVGLDEQHLERIASDTTATKTGVRDLGRVAVAGGIGATTVSGSLPAAHRVGIDTFAVAGIGGVHRGASTSFDISTDLTVFGTTPMAIVCAGVKSILDAGLTLEYLETLGVPVIGYASDDFPGYVSTSSGYPVPQRIDDLNEIARVVTAHRDLGAASSVLVTAPVPEEFAEPREEMETRILAALRAVEEDGITGPAVTPHMLRHMASNSQGATSKANREALLTITELGGRLAVEMSLEKKEYHS